MVQTTIGPRRMVQADLQAKHAGRDTLQHFVKHDHVTVLHSWHNQHSFGLHTGAGMQAARRRSSTERCSTTYGCGRSMPTMGPCLS